AERLLAGALGDKDPVVRAEAARALGRRAEPALFARLVAAIRGDKADRRGQEGLLLALAASNTRDRPEPLAAALAGVPAEHAPELAAALLRACERAWAPIGR
ncbi:MAG: hypothetical protein L0216_11245, partial [Planctomycetales bacterium]|nr:hypothetical protein [Planctomycetales bacterium]